MSWFTRGRGSTVDNRDVSRLVWDAGRRLRAALDTASILRAARKEIEAAGGGACVAFWLAMRDGTLCRAEDPECTEPTPDLVKRTANSWLPAFRRNEAAVPLVVPRGALQGVALITPGPSERWQRRFITGLGVELAYALQTSMLVSQAASAKERSEAIVTSVAAGIVVTDPRGRIREWNPSASEIFELGRDQAIGRTCMESMNLHSGERKIDCSAGCFLARQGAAAVGAEVWRPLPDGRRQPLLASATPVAESNEVVHSFRDITKLKEADEAKTHFLATASHELKTPLTVIQGYSDILLRQNGDNEDASEALEAIANRARSLNRIVDRILLSSRIESGRANVTVSSVDIAPLLRERAIAFGRATDREVRTEVPVTPLMVRADGEAVATVVDHLIDNAIKYSPGRESVLVSAQTKGDEIVVTVRDQGIGMDEQQAARCFEKFWQAESSDSRRFGGTGIGLFIVKSLIEAMDGEVRVESRPNAGTSFSFTLPRAVAADGLPPGIGERSSAREFMRQMGIRVTGEP